MNATIVISVSSVLVGMLCLVFFLLESDMYANQPIWGIVEGTEEESGDTGMIWFSRDESGVVSIKIPDEFDPDKSVGSYHVLTRRPGQFYEEVVRFDYDSNNTLTKCEGDHVDNIAEYEKFTSKATEAADGTLLIEFTDKSITRSPNTIHLEYEVTVGAVPAHISGLYEPATLEECQAFWETGLSERRRALQTESVLSGKPIGQLEMEQHYMRHLEDMEFDEDDVEAANEMRKLGKYGQLALESYDGGDNPIGGKCIENACVTKTGDVFAFRGSDDRYDWKSNLWDAFYDGEYVGGREMHAGFVKEFNTLKDWLKGQGASENSIFVGHSLGGAMAYVAAEHFEGVEKKPQVYTFGAPAAYSDKVGCQHDGDYRTFHEKDLVPYAASRIGYYHGQKSRKMYTHSYSCGKGNTCNRQELATHQGCNAQPSFWNGLKINWLGFSDHSAQQYSDWSKNY